MFGGNLIMYYKDKLDFGIYLKPVFWGTTVIKTLSIPFALITARLLSDVVKQAVHGNTGAVVKSSVIIFALLLLSVALQTAGNTTIRKKQAKAQNRCRNIFLEMLLKNPLDRLFHSDPGELNENLNDDIDASTKRFTKLYPNILSSVLTSFGYMLFIIRRSPLAAISLLAISLLQILPPVLVKKYLQINYDEDRKMEAVVTDHIIEGVKGFEVIKLYGLKHWWQSKLAGYNRKVLVIGRKTDTAYEVEGAMYRLLDNILKFGSYALMGIYMMLGLCSMDTVVQAIYLSSGLFGAVKSLFSSIPEIAVAGNAQKRIDAWICQTEGEAEGTRPGTNGGAKGFKSGINGEAKGVRPGMNVEASGVRPGTNGIALKELSYSYKNEDIIHACNYRFQSDKNYMIEGRNGIGKTTLFNLMTGVILPKEGDVLICGEHADHLRKDSRFKTLLYIPQHDPEYGFDVHTLFGMFDSDAQSTLDAVARRLGLTEEKMNGRAIRDLSGGERKKVFLSIGFALHPKWLLLDEPSNNLDQYGRESLCALLKERSGTIMISHDPVFRETVTCILKMENGSIYNE